MPSSFIIALNKAIDRPSNVSEAELAAIEVEDDLDAEENALAPSANDGVIDTDGGTDIATLVKDRVLNADHIRDVAQSANVQTSAGYKRLGRNFQAFLAETNEIKAGDPVFTAHPREDMPELIAAWIMNSCDQIGIDGVHLPPGAIRLSFANAQKMRAAASWNFGQVENQGNVPWRKSDSANLWTGNPSVSTLVSKYMMSLKRRKVQSGEVALSPRAITPGMLERLYDFNHESERSTVKPLGATTSKKWQGPRARLLCWTAYLFAFQCLLRVDEVLKIQAHDIRKDPDNDECIILHLPFRKTHQYGQIEPFYLFLLPEEQAHLCPVRAYCSWIEASGIHQGPLFPKMTGDRIREAATREPMSSAEFLEMFRNHLIDIKVDPYPYGTHSFRRGGCQYLHVYRRWSIREICQWGGWSTELSSLTIVKYLISANDNPLVQRKDFFNPNRPLQLKCPYCGRSCNCA